MQSKVNRQTVDLNGFPDLVVIYLGMRVNTLRGLLTLFRQGPQIEKAVAAKPDGLLLHEGLMFSLFPLHVGMRQYWRDFESMESWSRSLPHQAWWKSFLKDSEGTGFWHETYSIRGGMEAVYDDLPGPIGFGRFAPMSKARGPMFAARNRLKINGEAPLPPPVPEEEVSE